MRAFTFVRAVAVLSLLAGSLLHLSAGSARAAEAVTRSAGQDRIETAVAASRDHRDGASDALLANGRTFPDALSATALAATLDAPLLLTDAHTLPAAVGDELERLGVDTVWVLGGPTAVSWQVQGQLMERGLDVNRISGEDRYETARQLALETGPSDTGEVVLALGNHPQPDRAWPDALAAGTLAASPDRLPVLLTAHDRVPAATRDALDELDPDRILLVGGPAAIGPGVETALVEHGYDVERLAGDSRYDTSATLAQDTLSRIDGARQPIVFATGGGFADALAAGALAGSLQAPLVLVPPERLAEPVDRFLREHTDRWTGGVLVGGEAAASAFVADSLEAALNDAPAPEPPREPEPEPEEPVVVERVLGTFEGEASWYGSRFHGRRTASGERYNMYDLTAAHRTLPFGSRVRVTNLRNGREVVVRINDRGPFVRGRVIDLSRAAAAEIGMLSAGIAPVRGEVLSN